MLISTDCKACAVRSPSFLVVLLGILLGSSYAGAAEPGADQVRFFERHIRPVLMSTCLECHGRNQVERGLRVSSLASLLEGGASGAAIVAGDPDGSLLIQAIRGEHERFQMPPGEPLDQRVVGHFERWVADGAVWPDDLAASDDELSRLKHWADYWAFRPVTAPDVPQVEGASSPIDAFLLQAMREQGLQPADRADRRTLIRRATYGLTGLPPTPEEIAAFLEDESPDAFQRLVDRLLDSLDYGRRWGRHWLDVARYGDTSGDGTDQPIPEAHLYRDYVIDAFNQDMPYDQFLVEQIAGDLLASQEPEDRYDQRVIATGYIALSRRFGNRHGSDHHLTIENTLDTIGEGLLGMTVSCARCHDHRFDPIPTSDYYSLYGYFQSTRYPHAGTEHNRYREHFVPRLPDEQMLEARLAVLEEDHQATLAGLQQAEAEHSRRLDRVRFLLDEVRAHEGPVPMAWAVTDDKDGGRDARIHQAGNPRRQGDRVPRAFLSVVDDTIPDIPAQQSGRLQLARWIASNDNPLTPRVMVNRIWYHHFGRGIVESVNMFGVQGSPPTHPELLDWLATEFIESGWSIKHMHRLIMGSQAYQRTSAAHEANAAHDAENRYYWRFDKRRLEAEAIRDAVLFVSGRLDRRPHTKHPFPEESFKRLTQHNPFNDIYDHNHRTVYLMSPRLNRHPFIELFDGPDPNYPTGQRDVSTVPLQALFLMNSDFIQTNARAFARRLLDAEPEEAARLRQGYQHALGRPPTPQERDQMLAYLAEYEQQYAGSAEGGGRLAAWTSVARILFASNEFIYLD
ncbi:MAG: DUF1553 domain-containing protein [Planctomycetaceae bacterium]|nr:MAG: DUF1553 domain-containing protein [Planctomycetaceae bacterium]